MSPKDQEAKHLEGESPTKLSLCQYKSFITHNYQKPYKLLQHVGPREAHNQVLYNWATI